MEDDVPCICHIVRGRRSLVALATLVHSTGIPYMIAMWPWSIAALAEFYLNAEREALAGSGSGLDRDSFRSTVQCTKLVRAVA